MSLGPEPSGSYNITQEAGGGKGEEKKGEKRDAAAVAKGGTESGLMHRPGAGRAVLGEAPGPELAAREHSATRPLDGWTYCREVSQNHTLHF